MFVFLYQLDDAHSVDGRMLLEADEDDARGCVDLGHTLRLGQYPQAVGVDQGLRLCGKLAKAVDQFF